MAPAPVDLVGSVWLAVLVVPAVQVVVEVVAASAMEIVAVIATGSIGAPVVRVVLPGMAATMVRDVAVTQVVREEDAVEVLGSELVVPVRGIKTGDHE